MPKGRMDTGDLLNAVGRNFHAADVLDEMIKERSFAWADTFADDITFCGCECNNVACRRHTSRIRNKQYPHSMALLRGTALCPLTNGNSNTSAGYETEGGLRYGGEDRSSKG